MIQSRDLRESLFNNTAAAAAGDSYNNSCHLLSIF